MSAKRIADVLNHGHSQWKNPRVHVKSVRDDSSNEALDFAPTNKDHGMTKNSSEETNPAHKPMFDDSSHEEFDWNNSAEAKSCVDPNMVATSEQEIAACENSVPAQ